MRLGRWLLAGLSVLALVAATWASMALPWPTDAGRGQFVLIGTWLEFTASIQLERIAWLLPALVTLDAVLAAGLALALCLSTTAHPAVHWLRRALAFGALAAIYLFLIRPSLGIPEAWRLTTDIASFVLAGVAILDLTAFFANYPYLASQEQVTAHNRRRFGRSPIGRLTTSRYYASGWWDWLFKHDGTFERGSRMHSRLMELAVSKNFRCAWVAFSAGLGVLFSLAATNKISNAVVSFSCVMLPFVLLLMAFDWLNIKYRTGGIEDRRRIGWIYLGPFIGFLVVESGFFFPMLATIFLPGASNDPHWRIFGLSLMELWLVCTFLFAPLLTASFLLGVAVSVFYSGTIDPKLAIRRSLMVGLSAILLTVVFVALENLLSSALAVRLGLSSQAGTLISGVAAALAFAPMRVKLEKAVGRWLDRFMPRIEPESGSDRLA